MGINVNIGDVSRKGQLLAEIDPSTLSAQLSQAQAQASQQSASAQGAVVGLPVQVQSNNAAVQTAKAALANAKLVYDQNQQLFKQGYVSQTQLQQSQARYVQAQATYNNAVVALRNNVVSAQNVKAQLAGAQAASAQAHVLSTQLSQTEIYAPFDGVIANRLLDPGAYASPPQPVLPVSRVDIVWININVPDEDLGLRSSRHARQVPHVVPRQPSNSTDAFRPSTPCRPLERSRISRACRCSIRATSCGAACSSARRCPNSRPAMPS